MNWSVVFNILLLGVVIVAIGRLMKTRRQNISYKEKPPMEEARQVDDIIAVRKLNNEEIIHKLPPLDEGPISLKTLKTKEGENASPIDSSLGHSVMMFLLAKENRHFVGYELLQTILAAGLRFGEGDLFHRHQFSNGQGPVLCSLAAATASGIFDMQNIGGFRVKGLCLFMHFSGNTSVDSERLSIMYDTAKHLADGLDAHMLNEHREPLTEAGMTYYYQRLKLNEI